MNKTIYLKVKIKSLAEEARIIKREEHKCRDTILRNSLVNHRKVEVRREARASLIAYGYLRGRKFHQIECHTVPSMNVPKAMALSKAKSMVQRYGDPGAADGFNSWSKEF